MKQSIDDKQNQISIVLYFMYDVMIYQMAIYRKKLQIRIFEKKLFTCIKNQLFLHFFVEQNHDIIIMIT